MELHTIFKIISNYLNNNLTEIIFLIIYLIITIGYIFRLERVKSKLTQITQEHQIKFSHYYSERAEIIKKVYSKIYEVEQSALSYDEVYDDNIEEKFNQFLELETLINQNRIYFTDSLGKKFDMLLTKINSIIGLYPSMQTRIPDKEKSIIYSKIREYTENDIPELKKNIEIEFKKLLM